MAIKTNFTQDEKLLNLWVISIKTSTSKFNHIGMIMNQMIKITHTNKHNS